METFSTLQVVCEGNTGHQWFPLSQRSVTRSYDVFFELRLKKQQTHNRDAGDLKRHRAHYNVTVMNKRETPRDVMMVITTSSPAVYLKDSFVILMQISFNPLRPSDAYMCRYIMATSVQIMACRLDGAKPFSEPMRVYCQLEP